LKFLWNFLTAKSAVFASFEAKCARKGYSFSIKVIQNELYFPGHQGVKGSLTQDFRLQAFFMNQISPRS
jgi:hypothetical protein